MTIGDTTSTTNTTTESTNITTGDQTGDQRRGDILPIVYDVHSIPTIGTGGSGQIIRGGIGRQRPSMSSMLIENKTDEGFIGREFLVSATRRPWPARGPGGAGGRGSLGGRGTGGPGPAARQ